MEQCASIETTFDRGTFGTNAESERVNTAHPTKVMELLSEINQKEKDLLRERQPVIFNSHTAGIIAAVVVVGIFFGLVLAFASRVSHEEIWAWASFGFLSVAYIAVLSFPVSWLWVGRSAFRDLFVNPVGVLLGNAQLTCSADETSLAALLAFPKQTLELALMEVKAEVSYFERRIGLMIGTILNVGLLPGIVAWAVTFKEVLEFEFNWVQAVAYAVPPLYMFGVFAHHALMQLDRNARLLELIVSWKSSDSEKSL